MGESNGKVGKEALGRLTNAQVGAAVTAGKVDRKVAADFLLERMVAKAERQKVVSPI